MFAEFTKNINIFHRRGGFIIRATANIPILLLEILIGLWQLVRPILRDTQFLTCNCLVQGFKSSHSRVALRKDITTLENRWEMCSE